MSRILVVDPPSGWKYGFPMIWNPAVDPDLEQWFIRNGYPEEDIALAMKWSRYWDYVPDNKEEV